MKLYKIGISFAVSSLLLASCAINDPIKDIANIGQELPTVSWDLASTSCNAGDNMQFKGMYYPGKGQTIDHSEVWTSITRSESASVSVKLTKSYAYTKLISFTDTVRSFQMIQSYPHDESFMNEKYQQYEFTATFGTSQTLKPVSWVNPEEWDVKKFDLYFPANFQEEFLGTVIDALTKDSLYYSDVRNIYINYDFTAEQFMALNAKHGIDFPTETDPGNKSDLWFSNSAKVIGKYYKKPNGEYVEIYDGNYPDGVKLNDIYESSKWVFCFYDDDLGIPVSFVRKEYMPYVKDMITLIPFIDWIYNSADKVYTVEFTRDYKILPLFKVYDTRGKVGVCTDIKPIELK